MNKTKSVKLFHIEKYLRDKNKEGLYDAFEYIGDSIDNQDLVMAEEDFHYKAYLVNIVLDEVKGWDAAKIDKMVLDLGVFNE